MIIFKKLAKTGFVNAPLTAVGGVYPPMRRRFLRGFSLIEIVVVLTVIGVLSFAAVTRFADVDGIRLDITARKIQSDIRYAHSLALSAQARVSVRFNVSGNNYAIFREEGGSWIPVVDPLTKGAFTVNLNDTAFSGVVLARADFDGAGNHLVFDRWGDPYSCSVTGDACNLLQIGVVGIVSSAGRKRVNVERGTGRTAIQ